MQVINKAITDTPTNTTFGSSPIQVSQCFLADVTMIGTTIKSGNLTVLFQKSDASPLVTPPESSWTSIDGIGWNFSSNYNLTTNFAVVANFNWFRVFYLVSSAGQWTIVSTANFKGI